MPRSHGFGKGETARANVRLDPETLAFYKQRANAYGVSLSEHLRQCLTQGVVVETVLQIEERLSQAGDEIVAKVGEAQVREGMPILLQQVLLETHAMLVKIVESQSIQTLYDAQEIARVRLARLHSSTG